MFSPAENIQVALFMEQENIRLGKEKGFMGIFTTNSNRLTQLISRTLNYQVTGSHDYLKNSHHPFSNRLTCSSQGHSTSK